MGGVLPQTESNMKTTRPRSYQLGAAHERQSIKAHLKRLKLKANPEDSAFLLRLILWLDLRTARFTAKPGGLGRRKAKA